MYTIRIKLWEIYSSFKKKKKKLRESAGEKKSRMKAGPGTFLNEGENKRRRIEISTTCVKKKMYGWNEGWERRNNIMNKKSYLRNVTTIFSK